MPNHNFNDKIFTLIYCNYISRYKAPHEFSTSRKLMEACAWLPSNACPQIEAGEKLWRVFRENSTSSSSSSSLSSITLHKTSRSTLTSNLQLVGRKNSGVEVEEFVVILRHRWKDTTAVCLRDP